MYIIEPIHAKHHLSFLEHEIERLKKTKNDNSHIGTIILNDEETLNKEKVFEGIESTDIPQFSITFPVNNNEDQHTDQIKSFLELLMPHTHYEFHDTRKSPINDPTAKIDFIIVHKNGQCLWTELVVVIEGKGDINNTTKQLVKFVIGIWKF